MHIHTQRYALTHSTNAQLQLEKKTAQAHHTAANTRAHSHCTTLHDESTHLDQPVQQECVAVLSGVVGGRTAAMIAPLQ
jgi:hypothetical protein